MTELQVQDQELLSELAGYHVQTTRGTGLRIGLDARLLGDHLTGVGYYVSELCKEVDHILPGAEFFLYAPWEIKAPVESPRWHIRIDPWRTAFERLRGSWMTKHMWMLLRAGGLAIRDRVNVFWATDSPFVPRLPGGIRVVATVYDFRHRMTPDKMRRAALYGRIVLEKRLSRVDAFIAISSGTAQKLRRFLGYDVVGVARPAVSHHFFRRAENEVAPTLAKYGIGRPFLLTVSSADPHKNIELLVKTFLTMRAEAILPSHTLVLVGKKSDQLLEKVGRTAPGQVVRIKALGYVSEEDLPALYSGADVFILPSLDEGFGMPVLEARACQTKIVSSDLTELREAGGDRAIYIRPDSQGIRAGIMAALAAEAPSKRDRLWTWESSAKVLADALDPQEIAGSWNQ